MKYTTRQSRSTVTFIILFAIFYFPASFLFARAAALTFVRDLTSSSVPNAPANHTVTFTLTTAIPASGKIKIIPQDGQFTIPDLLDFSDIDFAVDGSEKTLGSAASGSTVGVAVSTSTSGSITLTAPAAIAAGSQIVVKIGANAVVGATGDQQIRNSGSAGSYRVAIETQDASGAVIDQASAMVAILRPVSVGAFASALETRSFSVTPTTATTTNFVNPDGVKLTIALPQDFVSFSDEVRLDIGSYRKEDFVSTMPAPSGKSAMGKVYDLKMVRVQDGSVVASFSKNLTVDFFYADSDVGSLNESTLRPFKRIGSQWVLVSGSAAYPDENRVRVPLGGFSLYTLMGDAPASSAPPPSTAAGPGGGAGVAPSAPVPTPVEKERPAIRGDVNKDNRVNLVDFSIAAYWYRRLSPPASVDINGDGRVDLIDFSIMAFYWTG